MGKRLIIKGADFSANAIKQVLPARYDYKLLEMIESDQKQASEAIQP